MMRTQRNFSERYQNFHDSESSSNLSEESSGEYANIRNKQVKKAKQMNTKSVQNLYKQHYLDHKIYNEVLRC